MLVTKSNPVGGVGWGETPGKGQQEKETQSRKKEREKGQKKVKRAEGEEESERNQDARDKTTEMEIGGWECGERGKEN